MIIGLFFVNIIGAFVILLNGSMLQNHFKKIENSMEVYLNPQVYKPERRTSFIKSALESYETFKRADKEVGDYQALLLNLFYKEKIGCFQYTTVHSIATKGKVFLWCLLIAQIGLQILLVKDKIPASNFSFIIANTILCMLMTLAGIILSIEEKKEVLLVKIKDYIVNYYPKELALKEKKEIDKSLEAKEIFVANKSQIEEKIEEKFQDILQEEDIVKLLNNFQ